MESERRADARPGRREPTLPAHPPGRQVLVLGATLLVVASVLVTAVPTAQGAPLPTLTLSAAEGTVGSSLKVSGTGFPAGIGLEIGFNSTYGTHASLCMPPTCSVAGNGSFSYAFSVPVEPNGTATVAAWNTTYVGASAQFTVLPHLLLAGSASPLTTVTVNGTGFDRTAGVTLTFNAATTNGTCDATITSSLGNLTCTFQVPRVPYGVYPVVVKDSAGTTSSVGFLVTPGGVLSRLVGPVGTKVKVSPDGFPAYGPLSVVWDPGLATAAVLNTTLTNFRGNAVGTVVVPIATRGSHVLQVVYSSTLYANFSFFVIGSLKVAPGAGYVGETNGTATGEGLPASSPGVLYWDVSLPGQSTLGSFTSLGNGTFSVPFTVPEATRGVHTVSVQFGRSVLGNASFTIDLSNVSLLPSTGPAGASFAASLVGFSGTSPTSVVWDYGLATQTLLANGTTSSRGVLNLTGLVVPAAALPGPHVVLALDGSGHRANTTYLVGPSLTIAPAGGPVGSVVYVAGSTFPTGHSIQLRWGSVSGPLLATVPALSGAPGYPYANFTSTLTVPASAAGPTSVCALVTGTSVVASATFRVSSSLALSATRGSVGATLTATAEGLAENSLSLLSLDAGPTGLGTTSNGSGAAVFSFPVPAEPAGAHLLTVSDAAGDVTNAVNFTVLPAVAGAPSTGYPGETVPVNLTGFAASSMATLAWDGVGTPATALTTANGSALGVTFSIPLTSLPGSHNLSAWDLAGDVASSIPLGVLPLPLVSLTAPAAGTVLNRSTAALSWSSSVGGGITFTLELATSGNFGAGLTTVPGLNSTVWTTPRLPDGTYYWRVEALAPGGGTAGFSPAASFLVDTVAPFSSVGPLPSTVAGLDLAIPFTATDPAPGSGVAGVVLLYSSDDGHDWVAYDAGELFTSSPIAFHAPVPGIYEFQTVAVDRAGNRQAPGAVGQASVAFQPLAVTPNYAPFVFLGTLAVLGIAGALGVLRYRRGKGPSSAPRPWSEKESDLESDSEASSANTSEGR